MNNEKKNCFITDEFHVIDHDTPIENPLDRYEYTENLHGFIDWLDDEKLFDAGNFDTIRELPEYEQWRDSISFEEQYEIPMMRALYYFPDSVNFEEDDRYKVAGNCTLLYDNELKRWAVGMTDGGMDLTPHLLDTFITLGKGVPVNVARHARRDYNAHVDKDTHAENCELLADAWLSQSIYTLGKYQDLSSSPDKTIDRHIKGIVKTLNKNE